MMRGTLVTLAATPIERAVRTALGDYRIVACSLDYRTALTVTRSATPERSWATRVSFRNRLQVWTRVSARDEFQLAFDVPVRNITTKVRQLALALQAGEGAATSRKDSK